MFDWQTHIRETAQWLVHMSRNPATVEHARHRARELMRQPMYAGLAAAMRQEVANERTQQQNQGDARRA